MRKLLDWCKREIVLSIAILLAVISAVIIHPDKEYINYIDFRTLAILFCLMAVMADFKNWFVPLCGRKIIGKGQPYSRADFYPDYAVLFL